MFVIFGLLVRFIFLLVVVTSVSVPILHALGPQFIVLFVVISEVNRYVKVEGPHLLNLRLLDRLLLPPVQPPGVLVPIGGGVLPFSSPLAGLEGVDLGLGLLVLSQTLLVGDLAPLLAWPLLLAAVPVLESAHQLVLPKGALARLWTEAVGKSAPTCLGLLLGLLESLAEEVGLLFFLLGAEVLVVLAKVVAHGLVPPHY